MHFAALGTMWAFSAFSESTSESNWAGPEFEWLRALTLNR